LGVVLPIPGLQLYSFSVGVVGDAAQNIIFSFRLIFGSDYGRLI
jgi:hypothetical protein